MGGDAAKPNCFNKKDGSTCDTSGNGSCPTCGCTSCGCPTCGENSFSNDPECCNDFPLGPGVDHPKESTDAFSRGAFSSPRDSGPTSVAASTRVTADIFQNTGNIYGVTTVAGRQKLRVLNGMLDLRWFLNQGFDSDTYAKYPFSGPVQFDPGGSGGTFGFLHWLKQVNGFPADAGNEFYSGAGGLTRDMVSKVTDLPADDSNPNQFNTKTGPYFKYDTQKQTYYWYNGGNLRTQDPRYVSKIQDGQGYTLYYNYQSNRLKNITGDIGQLVPYFGYDSGNRIDRIFLQDAVGNDHRSTYFSYEDSNALTRLLDPVGGASYFHIDTTGYGSMVAREVDPCLVVTYFVYDTGNSYLLTSLQVADRTTVFQDQGRSANAQSGAKLTDPRASRLFRRMPFNYHGFGVTSQVVGGSATYYEYTSTRNQIANQIDPNGQKTFFESNNANYRTKVSRPNGATAYFGYDSGNVNLTRRVGPRDTSAAPQVTYYDYVSVASGLRTKVLDPLGQAVYFGYDSQNRHIRSLDARLGATYYYYNSYNLNDVTLDALNNPAYFAFNANGRIARKQDALGHTTYYSYDKMDQLQVATSPTNETTYFELDKRGQIIREGRPGGRATYYAYDAYRRTEKSAQVSDTGLLATYFYYDEQDNTVASFDPRQNATYFGYDFRQKQIRTQDALNNTTYFVFDPSNNPTHTLDARGNWTLSEFDSVNQQVKSVRGVAGLRSPRMSAMQGHWNLNELSGTRADDSGNGNTLSENGSGSIGAQAGVIANAAQFDGSNQQFLSAPDSASLSVTGQLSVAAWANLSSFEPFSSILYPLAAKWGASGERGFSFGIIQISNPPAPGTTDLYLIISENGTDYFFCSAPALFEIELNEWHHYAATFDNADGRCRLYVDGFLLLDTTCSLRGIYDNSADFTVGALADTSYIDSYVPGYVTGLIDELCLYNGVLNQKEISQLVQQRLDVTFAAESTDLISTYFAYDLEGNRTTSVSPRNFTTYFGFDLINRLVQSQDPLGNATYFAYDPNNNQTKTLNPRGYATYFGYDLLSRQTQTLDAADRATYFGYDSVGNRVQALYPGVQTEYWGYDASNRLVQQMDRGGFSTYYGFDIAGNQDRVLNARRFATYFQFDLLDRTVATLDALNEPTYYEYDANGNRVRLTDHISGSSNSTTYFGYDALNRLVQQADPLNRSTYFEYDAVGNQVRVTMPGSPQQTSYMGYDKFNRLVQSLAPTNDASYFGYDTASNLVQTLNPRRFAAYFGYDALNRRSQTLNALNGSTYFGYDANGNMVRQVGVRWQESSPASFTTYFDYDPLDRLAQTTDALGNVTQRGYDSAGNLYALKPAVGGTAYFYYEPRNLLTRAVDGVGDETFYAYDEVGNRTIIVTGANQDGDGYGLQPYGTSPYGGDSADSGNATYFGYDALNRLAKVLDAEGGTAYFGYDVGGNTAQVLDALARATYFGYDKIDRLTTVLDALNQAVYFGYDLAGNRNVEMDALQHSTYYQYDVGNRLAAVLDPLNKAAYYGYDANSNLARTLDNNGTAVYFGYDALDRRTTIQYPSESQYFGYDAAGNLAKSLDAWGASYFGYDALSRLIQRKTPRNDAVYYGYDGVSNLLRLQYPQDALTCYYGYDAAQRLTQLLSPANFACYYDYDTSNDVTQRTMGNGVASTATFDRTNRMVSLRYAKNDGTALTYFDYGRDVAGRILCIQRENSLAIYYDYDGIDRLTAETWRKTSDNSQIYAFTYSYDAANNRLQQRRESTAGSELDSTYYSYAADNSLSKRQVCTPPSTVVDSYFYYDFNGALTALVEGGSPTYFGYGANQLVTRIQPPSENPSYFYYDGRLNRYLIDKAGTQTYYLWDGLNQLEERDSTGTLLARYTHGNYRQYGIGSVVEIERHAGAATYYQYPLMDHRGTVYAVTDQNQATQLAYTLDAFGRPLAGIGGAQPTVPNDLIYQSNWLTLQIGGRWYGISKYRIYDFELGIFLSRDRLPQYLNKYRAWSNNPVGQVDRDGLWSADETDEERKRNAEARNLEAARSAIEQDPNLPEKEKDKAIKDIERRLEQLSSPPPKEEKPPQNRFWICWRTADVYCGSCFAVSGGYHMWVRALDDKNKKEIEVGLGPLGGGVPGQPALDTSFFPMTSVNPHVGESEKPGSRCVEISDLVDFDCVRKEIATGPTGRKWALSKHDCNSWVYDIIYKCGKTLYGGGGSGALVEAKKRMEDRDKKK